MHIVCCSKINSSSASTAAPPAHMRCTIIWHFFPRHTHTHTPHTHTDNAHTKRCLLVPCCCSKARTCATRHSAIAGLRPYRGCFGDATGREHTLPSIMIKPKVCHAGGSHVPACQLRVTAPLLAAARCQAADAPPCRKGVRRRTTSSVCAQQATLSQHHVVIRVRIQSRQRTGRECLHLLCLHLLCRYRQTGFVNAREQKGRSSWHAWSACAVLPACILLNNMLPAIKKHQLNVPHAPPNEAATAGS